MYRRSVPNGTKIIRTSKISLLIVEGWVGVRYIVNPPCDEFPV